MKIEVIMSAYNNVRDLELVLDGYLNQLDNDFSLCIADDGSTHEVTDLIQKYSQTNLTIRHIWHEDLGFRRAAILNKAIKSSTADHIIFTDSDCIPSPHFVADHRKFASTEHYTVGIRVYLKPYLSNCFRNGSLTPSRLFNGFWLLSQSLKERVSKPEQALRYPGFILPIINRLKPDLTIFGSNIAMSLDSLLKVNGLDEDFEGWGYEDTDLLWRLEQIGLTSQGSLGRCCQYHLDHKENAPNPHAFNLFKQKQEDGKIYCDNGINKKA
ncbi:glycosyltransferase [Photobacterium leiognathi]|nr:glycosyltransferase [Photobacterium leiognathi]KJF90889.1 glycosyl transferase [Photobacterium leiognathi]